ncbi:uncharacterized protein LOC122376169, partial [Amphibalanus amphitrite]|uniref:uncharacterized protein LOC122376169 n=1 Tax=Amphibalanus amphitrite TaxID=1232801 RepID=UPI001C91B9D9
MVQTGACPPGPGMVRIAVISAPEEFAAERRHLLEYALPELQRHYIQRGIEVEMVGLLTSGHRWNPQLCNDLRAEIEDCHSVSQAVFALFLVGDRRGPFCPPGRLSQETFDRLRIWAGEAAGMLETAYDRDENSLPPQLVYRDDRESGSDQGTTELVNLLRKAEREGVFSYQSVLESLVESALDQSSAAWSRCLLAIPPDDSAAQSADCADNVIGMRQWRRSLLERLGKDNVVPI